jgi:hypothetical protein
VINLFAAEERAAKRDRLGDPIKVLDRAIVEVSGDSGSFALGNEHGA